MQHSAERYFYHFQACPDSLFMWVYVGINEYGQKDHPKKKKQNKNAIQLVYKDRTYDPQTKAGDVAIDIYVLGMRWWKDQHLGTRQIEDSLAAEAGYTHSSYLTATYSGSILEGAHVMVRMDSLNAHTTRVHYEFSLTFGKVLAAFISDNVWKDAIAWRFKIILANLVEYAETGEVRQKDHVWDDD